MLEMYESTYFPKDFNAIPNVVTAWAGPRLANDPFAQVWDPSWSA